MDNSASDERRQAQRVAVDFEASYSINPPKIWRGRIREISRTGLQLQSLESIPIRAKIQIMFSPSSRGSASAGNQLCISGRVIRLLAEARPSYDYGIEVLPDDIVPVFLQVGGSAFENCLGGGGGEPRPTEDQRRFMRVEVDYKASYSAPGATSKLSARVTEISRKGLRLRVGEKLAIRSLTEITFEMAKGRRVRVLAQVVRLVREVDSEFEFGIAVLSDVAVESALQWAVLQVGLKDATKRTGSRAIPVERVR